MSDLFSSSKEVGNIVEDENRPLADRLRPKVLQDVIGQEHLLGEGGSLKRMLDNKRLGSLILWGPPGTGKTTVAQLLADEIGFRFKQISAVFSGVADLKKAFEEARFYRQSGQNTLLFVDEIHRFNRAQQDGFLPVMEDGTIVMVGATTQNPSFELNSALLSRAQVLRFEPLAEADLEALLTRAENLLGQKLALEETARLGLLGMADGDGRALLGMVEDLLASKKSGEVLSHEQMVAMLSRRAPVYDKSEDGHYNLISALHKTIRGSDPDAALYYFSRMIDGGEDPMFLARRLIRMAVEDIGLADPNALVQSIAARDAYEMLGSPEGELALAQVVVYLAIAPKSNAIYKAFSAATKLAKKTGSPLPPMSILNAPTKMMKNEGYGYGYIYDHDTEHGFSGQEYFPEKIGRQKFYTPVERGYEREIKKRLDYFGRLRSKIDK